MSRLLSAARYLSFSEPPWRWRLSRGTCPLCSGHWFLSFMPTPFMTRCLGCRYNVMALASVSVLQRLARSVETAYELQSYGATYEHLRRIAKRVERSEYFPDRPAGELVAGIRNEDVQRLTWPDDSFDVVTSNGVMEHVPEDVQGFRECLRVLRPGGSLVFNVPLYDTPATVRLAELRNGSLVWHGPEEWHDSRLGGPKSTPTFWRHSRRDICQRVKSAGFDQVELVDVFLAPAQVEPQRIVWALKRAASASIPSAPSS